jgi:endonuclease III-like uncharacterized protein
MEEIRAVESLGRCLHTLLHCSVKDLRIAISAQSTIQSFHSNQQRQAINSIRGIVNNEATHILLYAQ